MQLTDDDFFTTASIIFVSQFESFVAHRVFGASVVQCIGYNAEVGFILPGLRTRILWNTLHVAIVVPSNKSLFAFASLNAYVRANDSFSIWIITSAITVVRPTACIEDFVLLAR
jgi:hypothetical protein